ncbi:hypothetical protein ACGFZG_21930 [Streptomyces antibioticus]|uniref:hypothetical protein n=1 Tax=Streptomyces antibioticus TaxID=1890 RepID=UPI00371EE21E
MSLYRVLLAEGQRADLIRFLNKDLLVDQWPILRRFISRHPRDVWEEAFIELAQAASSPLHRSVGAPRLVATEEEGQEPS